MANKARNDHMNHLVYKTPIETSNNGSKSEETLSKYG